MKCLTENFGIFGDMGWFCLNLLYFFFF
uniref:Uncharacterized protein n=1 Tax=Rhizophora mucronata TaxID=61149 RepID=A0A2P2IHH0_RHIMU